jgi:hypothetical protein
MAVIDRCSYKLEFRTYSSGYAWTDYTSRLDKFGDISHQVDSALMPNSFASSIGDIIVDNSDGFWTTQSDTALFNNTTEPYGKYFRRRRVRVSMDVPDVSGTTTNVMLFTGLVDELIIDPINGKAKIRCISLAREAQEQKLDADKINNHTLAGTWGTAKTYLSRTLTEGNNYLYEWYSNRRYTDMLKRTSEALDDSAYSHAQIEPATADGRRVAGTLDYLNNLTTAGSEALADHTVKGIFSAGGKVYIFTVSTLDDEAKCLEYDPATSVITERWGNLYGSAIQGIYAFWYNTATARLFFVVRYTSGASTLHNLVQLDPADGYAETIKAIETAAPGFSGAVCYCPLKDGDETNPGTVYFAASFSGPNSSLISQYRCGNIAVNFDRLQLSGELYEATKQITDIYLMTCEGYSTATHRLFFAAKCEIGDMQHRLFKFDIDTGWLFANVAEVDVINEYTSFISLYAASDRVFYVETSQSTYRVWGTVDAGTPAALFAPGDQFRKISPIVHGYDGIYFLEYADSATAGWFSCPTKLWSIKDAAPTVLVPENLIAAGATYGENIIDNNPGLVEFSVSRGSGLVFQNEVAVAFTYDSTSPWKLYLITKGLIVVRYATTISPFLRVCEYRGLSAWDFRKLLAEKYNAVIYYDENGKFWFAARPVAGTSQATLSAPVISSLDYGYRTVKNALKGIPYALPWDSLAGFEVTPILVLMPGSTMGLAKILIGQGNTVNSRWRIKFTSATAFNLDEGAADGTYTNRTTGTKGTTLSYSASGKVFTVDGAAWTGTAVSGDVVIFSIWKPELAYTKLPEAARQEASDATSIERYQRTEAEFDNRYIDKMQLIDLLTAILAYWKNPHRVVASKTVYDTTYAMFYRVAFADTAIGVTTATVWFVTKKVIRWGEPLLELELTEIV